MSRRPNVLRNPRHIKPGRRGDSSALPTPRLGNGKQLTDSQLRRIENCALKVPYTCQAVAQTAAMALGWCGLNLEVYACPVCSYWHLTKTRNA